MQYSIVKNETTDYEIVSEYFNPSGSNHSPGAKQPTCKVAFRKIALDLTDFSTPPSPHPRQMPKLLQNPRPIKNFFLSLENKRCTETVPDKKPIDFETSLHTKEHYSLRKGQLFKRPHRHQLLPWLQHQQYLSPHRQPRPKH